jgi:hypothetical protein
MNINTKNRLVFSLQLGFFIILYLIIIFIEINDLYELYAGETLFFPYFSALRDSSFYFEVFISNFFIYFTFVNQFIAGFSMYGFLFKLRIFEKDSPKTIPVCAISTDIAMINIFLTHFITYKDQYFAYFTIFPAISSLIPGIISVFQIPVIFLTIALLSMLMNIYYGLYSIKLGRAYHWSHSFITIFFHIIMLINGIIALISFIVYLIRFFIQIYSIILSIIIALTLFSFFIYLLVKKELKYPYEAIYQWRNHKKIKKK